MPNMEHPEHVTGVKCDACGYYAEGMAVAPAMTAHTWDELDAQHAVLEQTEEIQELTSQYNAIVQGIVGAIDMEPEERARLLTDAATGYADRVAATRAQPEEDTRAIVPGRIARLLGAKVTNGDGLGPDAFAVVGDPDKPGTWQLRIDDAEHISGAIQALSPSGFRGNKVQLDSGTRAGAIRKIRAAVNKLPEDRRGNLVERLDALKALDEPSKPSSIALLPGSDGTYERVAMWASNNFRDRQGEIFAADAIRGAAARFNARPGVKGHANIWHVGHPKWGFAPEQRGISDWADIEHAAYVDGFLFVEGPVTNQTAAAYVAEWSKAEPLGTSIEYSYVDGIDESAGVYSGFDFDRVTVCARDYAVNPWNPVIAGTRGSDMPFEDPKIRAHIEAIWGADFVREQEEAAQRQLSANAAAGLDAKSLDIALPPATIKFVVEAAKDAPSTAVAADPGEASVTTADAPAVEGPPAWFLAWQEQQAAKDAARDAEVKAIKDAQEASTGAAGILNNSVQFGNASAEATRARAIAEIANEGKAQDAFGGEDYGVASLIVSDLLGKNTQAAPAGA